MIKSKRTISNSNDLKSYLTPDKIEHFRTSIYNFLKISNELDKKIIDIKRTNKFQNIVCDNDMYDINVIVSHIIKK